MVNKSREATFMGVMTRLCRIVWEDSFSHLNRYSQVLETIGH